MSNIENLQLDLDRIKSLEEKKLKEDGMLESYGGIKVDKIKENIYSVTSLKTNNLQYYVDSKDILIFSIQDIIRKGSDKKYLEKLGLEYTKEENGEYSMYRIDKDGKKIPIDKYSEQYFNVWKDVFFLQGRDVVRYTYLGDNRNVVHKVDNETLDNFLSDKALRPIDLAIFKSKGNITKEQFDAYKDKVAGILLDQVKMNALFGKLPDIKLSFKFNGREYQIHTSHITQDELDYYFNTNLITKKIYDDCTRELKAEQEVSRLKAKEQRNIVSAELDDLRNDVTGIA